LTGSDLGEEIVDDDVGMGDGRREGVLDGNH